MNQEPGTNLEIKLFAQNVYQAQFPLMAKSDVNGENTNPIYRQLRRNSSLYDLLIIGNVLKPSQLYKINELLRPINAKARDRVDLILKIFDKNAQETEAKLQIELASIKHM